MPLTPWRSRRVASSQERIHPRLAAVVRRHLDCAWRQPVAEHTRTAFENVRALLRAGEHQRIVLDSGCGTGASTRRLAAHHPGCVIIGVDRSAHRLAPAAAGPVREADMIWVRAELADFWRLARDAGWALRAHYLLYPNPWPKPAHLRRRWHAHPVFPALLALGGTLVLRSNWVIYVREFRRALELAGRTEARVHSVRPGSFLSPFERKYALSGHALFELSLPGSGTGTPGSRPA